MSFKFESAIANHQAGFPGYLKAEGSDDLSAPGLKELKELKEPRPLATATVGLARELEFYKGLYFKLQNLEEHSDVIPVARQAFLVLLSQALEDYAKAPETNILSVQHFDSEALSRFLRNDQNGVTSQYHQYISRRRSGGPRELFLNRQAAGDWLREIAPLKLVDGAWLGHLNKITMPFSLRHTVKQTWQVFTDELGNGNPDQHHVKIFEDLLRVIEPDLPSATTKAILHPRYRLGSLKYWRAAVAQLLVSLFPHEFLPEILGFNMHFEALQLETMQAAKELPEVGFDGYYFLLHVSIDNSHSGHAAMATASVEDYVQHIAESEGDVAADAVWKRIRAGYIFSEWQFRKGNQATNILARLDDDSHGRLESRQSKVLAIFGSKIQAAHRLHCGSRVKIGERLLADWLDPEAFSTEEWRQKFIESLSASKPWIYPGDSQRSKLVQALQWGGKIKHSPSHYSFIGQSPMRLTLDHSDHVALAAGSRAIEPATLASLRKHPGDRTAHLNIAHLLPLWFTQCCLLESFLYAPQRSGDKIGCAVVGFLRAQSGFETDDQPYSAENGGIVEFGLEMIRQASLPVPEDLDGILSVWPSDFATTMLKLASSPIRNFGVLLGMSLAFLELQEMMSESSNPGLLCPKSSERLATLVRKQYQYLQICLGEIPAGDARRGDIDRGFSMAKIEIHKRFGLVQHPTSTPFHS
ncbi:conserved hypothetical protein [Talaromyces stipitatus ATCC 10500]|uniref:Iron-containing redox enzyme family protein n=1 Tax=Talaromyces stipitatus (strain ATCC 10500 / CBS 375.48 / QM 6759 / NRRL 1006) TaxID=441959 RepID=B8M906_TALSN|nr:uncharacterized protein TSTA_111430 [Talaromyces stipitatus ATCC 10500]EED17302.1 conserved hypothetical protein [Talaromyces stipitatus ATCC 10500]